jgi:hypothetical protein
MWLVGPCAPLPPEVLVTCRSTSRRWTWVPSDAHINTGRLCSTGSRSDPVPRRPRSYAALRLPASIGHHSGSPCGGLPRGGRFFCALRADDTCARQRVVRRRRVTGSPLHRDCLRGEARASQGTRPSSSYVLWSNTPPDTPPSLPNIVTQEGVVAFAVFQHSRPPESL